MYDIFQQKIKICRENIGGDFNCPQKNLLFDATIIIVALLQNYYKIAIYL